MATQFTSLSILFFLLSYTAYSCDLLPYQRRCEKNTMFEPLDCGLHSIRCMYKALEIQFLSKGQWYVVKELQKYNKTLTVQDRNLSSLLRTSDCDFLYSFTPPLHGFPLALPPQHLISKFFSSNCENRDSNFSQDIFHNMHDHTQCQNYSLCYSQKANRPSSHDLPPMRVTNDPPLFQWNLTYCGELGNSNDFSIVAAGFSNKWAIYSDCFNCQVTGSDCMPDAATNPTCKSKGSNPKLKIALGVPAGILGIIVVCGVFYFCYQRKKNKAKSASTTSLSRSSSFDPSFKKDPELGNTHYQTNIFTYKELLEATDGFADSKELGDGGFGTVYHGKLKDGRIVAVKRLYENNYKRVEQFMNEVEILNRLRHKNLVTLYGCTSRHSRELLLVYEYVANGTVADHLHGHRASEGVLTWPLRMSIAIETADALTYLHAAEPQIIHRDIKTNNILLDNNFGVKVADFGLSRLFPVDATHVSTAPQGTPGYLDPEYHQCYQLTDKSDVYSFGVVLVELISSKPAVDITRHRYEINLSNMAVNKIQNGLLHELVDPGIGFESDSGVRRMVTLVSELAFRCLQGEKEMRPSMEEVLDVLRGIEDGVYKAEKKEADETVKDDASLLKKNGVPFSPDSVTNKWASKSTTPNTSE